MLLSDTIVKPQWTSFACVLLRREMLDKIGLMDDGFFMYFEDVEFCRRARKAGWEIFHNPKARVIHLRGGSSPVKKNTLERKRLPRYYYMIAKPLFLSGIWTPRDDTRQCTLVLGALRIEMPRAFGEAGAWCSGKGVAGHLDELDSSRLSMAR